MRFEASSRLDVSEVIKIVCEQTKELRRNSADFAYAEGVTAAALVFKSANANVQRDCSTAGLFPRGSRFR